MNLLLFFSSLIKILYKKEKKILLSKKIYGRILVKIFILNVFVQFSLYQNYKFYKGQCLYSREINFLAWIK